MRTTTFLILIGVKDTGKTAAFQIQVAEMMDPKLALSKSQNNTTEANQQENSNLVATMPKFRKTTISEFNNGTKK